MSLYVYYKSFKNMLKHPFKMSRFLSEMKRYNKANTNPEFKASMKNLYLCLNDWDDAAGTLGVYFYQDLWAARKIFQRKPTEHFDIGSRIDGFVAHVLSFVPVTMIDIRPLSRRVENLNFVQADATNLENIPDGSITSLSSLCAPEHFGLGRYGDPIDPEACFKAMRSMQRVLTRGGYLYVAVPIGDENVVAFNAHRIFKPELIAETLNELKLSDFSVISDIRKCHGYSEHIDFKKFHEMNLGTDNSGCVVGLFEFVKE